MAANLTQKNIINTVVSGVTGKMGHALLKALTNRKDKFHITGGLSRIDNLGKDLGIKMNLHLGVSCSINLDEVKDIDVVIDFSEPNFSIEILNLVLDRKVPIVMGTTGHSKYQIKQIEKASTFIPILLTSNTSLGIAFIKNLLTLSSGMLARFETKRIYEKHHKHKKDSPSGTALNLSKHLKELENNQEDISIESKREGNSLGEHSIILERKGFRSEEGETIEITHIAHDRSIFAEGALLAAEWLVNQKKGLYGMTDFYLT